MDATKKLVRGLKDVSPLFSPGAAPEETFARQTPELQVIAVSSPDNEGDSLFLNTYFASQIASSEKPCSIVSILSRCSKGFQIGEKSRCETLGEHLQRYCLYWDEIRDLLSDSANAPGGSVIKSRDMFLDFEYRHLVHFSPVIRLLDKWVLLLKPTLESLTEGYKMMKTGLSLNPQIEFFIALEGEPYRSNGEVVFERFSEFAFEHLHVDLGWLGWVDLSDQERRVAAGSHAERLAFQTWNEKPLLEKFCLAGWIESMEPNVPGKVFVEAPR